VISFARTRDLDVVKQVLTARGLYEHMGDDYLPAPEHFVPNDHPEILYVTAMEGRHFTGLFTLIPRNRHCFEIHACMMPEALTEEKWEAARGITRWIGERTECRRLVAEVPSSNRPAIYFGTHGLGMKYVGTHPQCFLRYGKMQDLIILGRGINSGEQRHDALYTATEHPAALNSRYGDPEFSDDRRSHKVEV